MANHYYQALTPTQQAKKVLKNDIARVSVILLCILLFSNIFSVVFSFLFALGGSLYYMKVNGGFDPAIMQELMITLQASPMGNFILTCVPIIAADLLVIVIAQSTLTFPYQSPICKKAPSKRKFAFLGVLSCSGVSVLGIAGTYLIIGICSLFGLEVMGPDLSVTESAPLSNALMLLYACILAPIMEEVIFRGYILNRLKRHGKLFAMVVSAIFFAMFHSNLIQFCTPFFLGMLLSFLTLESDSIRPAIAAHIFNNTMAFALDYIPNEAVYTVASVVYLAVGLYALRRFSRTNSMRIKAACRDRSLYLSMGQQFGAVFATPAFLIYLVLYLLSILMLFMMA